MKCYHCDFDCALVKNEPEELKHCDSDDELCMRGTISKHEFISRNYLIKKFKSWTVPIHIISNLTSIIWTEAEGNTVQVSGCHLAQGKAGKCEKINIMNVESEVCYCDTDGCNGTSNIQPQSLTVLLAITGILMMLGFK